VQSESYGYKHTEPTTKSVSAGSPAWDCIRSPQAGVRVFEEIQPNTANIKSHHVLLSAGQDAVKDEDVPDLAADAYRWRSLAADVPGVEPHMVLLVDLHSRVEEHMCLQMNKMLIAEGLRPLPFVSHLFLALGAASASAHKLAAMQKVATAFCEQFGHALVGDVIQQWGTLMEWRAKRVAFAHPLSGPGLNKDSLHQIEQAVDVDPVFTPVQHAAHVIVAAAKQLLQ